MKYVSFDIESTTLTPHPNNVLSFAMVVEDSTKEIPLRDLPCLKGILLHTPRDTDNVAMAMNAPLLGARAMVSGQSSMSTLERLLPARTFSAVQELLDPENEYLFFDDWNMAKQAVSEWLEIQGLKRPTLAGKNVGSFDFQFLPKDVQALFSHLFLDPGPMYWKSTDSKMPGLEECCRRAGVSDLVTHDAYEDALQVIEVIRRANAAHG